MNEATIEIETPSGHAPGVLWEIQRIRDQSKNRAARLAAGVESGSPQDKAFESVSVGLAEALIDQHFAQSPESPETIRYEGDAHLLSDALDYRMMKSGEELNRRLSTSPVMYGAAESLIEELAVLAPIAARVDEVYRGAAA